MTVMDACHLQSSTQFMLIGFAAVGPGAHHVRVYCHFLRAPGPHNSHSIRAGEGGWGVQRGTRTHASISE
jgi:hypothetical protein